ncbi:hypothetical protein [Citrobacter pasteurii]
MDKAICAITLSTSKPMLVEAVWHKGNLTLLSEQTLPADRKGLLDVLPNIIHEIEKNGDDVLVDERSGFFSSTGGKHIQFAAPGTSGKPILVESLDLYRELSLQKAIIRPKRGSRDFPSKNDKVLWRPRRPWPPEGYYFSLTGKYPSIERISSSRSGNFSLNSKW